MRKEERAVGRERYQRSSFEKAELMERWCESGLSRAEFCRREGICYGSFLGWIAQWIEREETVPEFVEGLEAVPEACRSVDGNGGIEVAALDGWSVKFLAFPLSRGPL